MFRTFNHWDWLAMAVYLFAVVVIGVSFRRKKENAEGFVRGNRSLPFWAVGLSMLATALGADDFIGEPQFAFSRDFALLGAFAIGYFGIFVVAFAFLPRFYRSGALTIYGYLGQRFGKGAQIAASASATVSGVISGGIGLFVATFAITPLMGNPSANYTELRPWVLMTLVLIGLIGTLYTTLGGIRSVVWTDVFQTIVIFAGGCYAIYFLLSEIPLSFSEILTTLSETKVPAANTQQTNLEYKLTLFRGSGGISDAYSPWTLPLWALYFVGVFGTTHSYTQRFLACKSPRQAGLGLVFGYSVGMLSAVMFLAIGALVFLFSSESVMGSGASVKAFAASEEVYPRLVVDFFPKGLLGLSVAAMLAAVMSTFDSATAAIASTFSADVLRPIRDRIISGNLSSGQTGEMDEAVPQGSPILATAITGILLTCSGVLTAWFYDPQKKLLVDFVLGFSSFPLGGMIGVFCTALFTRRGNSASVIAALIIGPVIWWLVQPEQFIQSADANQSPIPVLGISLSIDTLTGYLFSWKLKLAWLWWFTIAGIVSFFVCCSGKPEQ